MSIDPVVSHRSRSPPRSAPVTPARPSRAALIPPALVPDKTSVVTVTSSSLSSSWYNSRHFSSQSGSGAAPSALARVFCDSRRLLACWRRFISRATPPIHTARLTPPDIATANRISCPASELDEFSECTAAPQRLRARGARRIHPDERQG